MCIETTSRHNQEGEERAAEANRKTQRGETFRPTDRAIRHVTDERTNVPTTTGDEKNRERSMVNWIKDGVKMWRHRTTVSDHTVDLPAGLHSEFRM